MLLLFENIVDSYETRSGHGLPVGSLTSQYFANDFLLRLRDQRRDAFERGGVFLAGGGEVVHVLEVEPVFGRGAEVLAEAQRGGGGDALAALDDGGDPAVGQAGVLGEPVLGDAQIAERFLERLAGMRDCEGVGRLSWRVQW